MGTNLDRVRALLRGLRDEDPHADVRRQVIASSPQDRPDRARAVALLSADLVRDPSDLMTGDPPTWLVGLSRSAKSGASLLFDGRLTELSARAVDDLLSQGCTVDELVLWLEDRARAAAATSPRALA